MTGTIRTAGRVARILIATVPPLLTPGAAGAADCLPDYVDCVERASDLETFTRRSLAGLDCYLGLIHCLQRRLA